MPAGKCKWDEYTDHLLVLLYLRHGPNWKLIAREMMEKHQGAVLGRSEKQVNESIRKRFAKLRDSMDSLVEPLREYPGPEVDTSEDEWDLREEHRRLLQ